MSTRRQQHESIPALRMLQNCHSVKGRRTRRKANGYATRQSRNKHHITLIKEDEAVVPSLPLLFSGLVDLPSTAVVIIATKDYKAFLPIVDIQRFRNALVMFFVMCSTVFSIIESFIMKRFCSLLSRRVTAFLSPCRYQVKAMDVGGTRERETGS